MAWSIACFLAGLSALAITTNAETVTLDWNITWVRANPDGMAERPVMGINGQWPLPLLNFTKGDRVVANVHNQVR
jgi:iron transport multicopper oxidase